MRIFLILIGVVLIHTNPAFAQLNDMLKLLEELKTQFDSLQEAFTTQGVQIETLSDQLGSLATRWDEAQTLLDRVPVLEQSVGPLLEQTSEWPEVLNQVFATQQQLAPLLQQWPAVQEMLNSVASLQGSFNDQLQTIAEIQQTIQSGAQPPDGARMGTLELQLASLQQTVQNLQTEREQLGRQMDNLQLWLWVMLGGVALLLVAQVAARIISAQRNPSAS